MEIFIWQARDRKNLSVTELSKLTGISRSTLNNIENGKYSPKLEQLERIAKVLGCRMSDLYDSPYK